MLSQSQPGVVETTMIDTCEKPAKKDILPANEFLKRRKNKEAPAADEA